MRTVVLALLCAALCGCVEIENAPINLPVTPGSQPLPVYPPRSDETTALGVAFSGGGTRAAAFSFGVLKQLATLPADDASGTLLDHVDFVSGVSGGSITASYFGLHGLDALLDFREAFLIQDVEAHLHTSPYDPMNFFRAYAGGVNDRRGMQAWLDDHLFHGATFSALAGPGKPAIWINASDIYNNTPFVFDPEDFAPLCSDLSKLPLSEGVAASAAVPIAFAPIVMQSFPKACDYTPPAWATAALADPNAPQNLRAYAQALLNYNNPAAMKYVKLLDGGLVDNFGLAALTLRRQEADPKTIAPMSPEQAVHLRRLMFVVVDAGQSTDNSWVKTVTGPTGPVIAMAAADTALNVAKLQSYDLFHDEMDHWQKRIVAWRCALSRDDVIRLRGSDAGWDCRDLHFYVARVSFSLLDPATADELSVMPTTLSLPAASVDLLIKGGGDALMRAPEFQDFLRAGEKKVSGLQPASSSAGLPRG